MKLHLLIENCPENLETLLRNWCIALGLISRFNTSIADGEKKWTIIQYIKTGE